MVPDFPCVFEYLVMWDDARHAAWFASYDRALSHFHLLIRDGFSPVSLHVTMKSVKLNSYDGGSQDER